MSFIPEPDVWLKSHFDTAAEKIVSSVFGIEGKTVLSVGCGEPLIEFGVLSRGAKRIVGLDIVPEIAGSFATTADKLSSNGFSVPADYSSRMEYVQYDGVDFPFEDASFDAVYSWGVFEHVADVRQVLSEMRRVMKPSSWGMVSVFPWFPSYYGSHLSDYIPEPFFHLKETDEWTKVKLEEYADKNPQARDLVTRHMWQEFKSLNRKSPEEFYRDVKSIGFSRHAWELLSYETTLTEAPNDATLSDLMICGTTVRFMK
ncbi:hypothetical protein A6U86_28780 [Rhizobium sp. AC27/96]|uniref:class I SAM-dependent methyltransferase n=1 Tax=Rhizobium sp. AC27/96 TaxID=1841653 RepID=UPI0008292704|nr:methyltransferase domain-containing protein [Rhizobium sp. AC27/96]OCJ07723.1 hypothetical protein A6U86_28780 [Rhizobium sp. AC27/96]